MFITRNQITTLISNLDRTCLFLLGVLGIALFFLFNYSQTNYSLIEDNKKLKERVDKLQIAEVGDAVPELQSVDILGQPAIMKFANTKHLIFIYSTYCEFCKSDFPLWNEIIKELQSEHRNVHALSLDSQADTDNNLGQNFDSLRAVSIIAPNKDVIRTYRALATPTIMIVSKNGLVEWIHVGTLKSEKVLELKTKLRASE